MSRSSSAIDLLTALSPLLLGGGKTTTNVGGKTETTNSGVDPNVLATLTNQLNSGAYSAASAKSDSTGAVNLLIQQILQGGGNNNTPGLPTIAQEQTGAGMFNSTPANMQTAQLEAQAAGQGAALTTQNITNYGNTEAQLTNALTNAAPKTVVTSPSTNIAQTAPVVNPLVTLGGAMLMSGANSLGIHPIDALTGLMKSGGSKLLDSAGSTLSGMTSGTGADALTAALTPEAMASGLTSSVGTGLTADLGSAGLTSALGGSVPSATSGITGTLGAALGAGTDTGTAALTDSIGSLGTDAAAGIASSEGAASASASSSGLGLGEALMGVLGCFITTAVCRFSHKADDCEELVLLRKFRDTFMIPSPIRKELVDMYYAEAPVIVEVIESLSEARKRLIYTSFLLDFINPAIDAIKTGHNELALMYYTKMFKLAREIAKNEVDGD